MPAVPVDHFSLVHAYNQVANDVARRIAAGEITRKLPAERDLAEEYGVSYVTTRHAMAVLRERGLIITVHGRGTFVAAALDDDAPSASPARGASTEAGTDAGTDAGPGTDAGGADR